MLDDLLLTVSPLFAPAKCITVSGVPLFISNEMLEKELNHFGKFASRFKNVHLGCKDSRLQHVQVFWEMAFIYLNDPAQTLKVSFNVKYENVCYAIRASSGCMKCCE